MPRQSAAAFGVRFCGSHAAPSISRASRTIAMTSAGRSSIMEEVKRNTHQPSRIEQILTPTIGLKDLRVVVVKPAVDLDGQLDVAEGDIDEEQRATDQ